MVVAKMTEHRERRIALASKSEAAVGGVSQPTRLGVLRLARAAEAPPARRRLFVQMWHAELGFRKAALVALQDHPAGQWILPFPWAPSPSIGRPGGGDRNRAGPFVSSLWAFAGLAPSHYYRTRGRAFHPSVRQTVHSIGRVLRNVSGPYQTVHRLYLEEYEAANGYSAAARQGLAERKLVKLFLGHLWIVWRQAIGLPASDRKIDTRFRDPWLLAEA